VGGGWVHVSDVVFVVAGGLVGRVVVACYTCCADVDGLGDGLVGADGAEFAVGPEEEAGVDEGAEGCGYGDEEGRGVPAEAGGDEEAVEYC